MPEFTLDRGDTGIAIAALEASIELWRAELRKVQRRKRHIPGEAAAIAVQIAGAIEIRDRLLAYCVENGWIPKADQPAPKPRLVKPNKSEVIQ